MTTSLRFHARPSPVTARRWTVAMAAAALATVLAACGSVGSTGSSTTGSPAGKGPAKIRIAGGGGAATRSATAAAPAAADAKIAGGPLGMPYRPTTYEVRGTLPALDGDAQAWSYPAGGAAVTTADVARLARALGLDGPVTPVPTDEGGGFRVGPNDGSGPTLNVSADAVGSWWYSALTAPTAVACAGSVGVAEGASGVPVTPTTIALGDCGAPTPPDGVPSADEATAATRRLAKAIGATVDAADIEVSGDDYGRYAAMYERLDGVRSPLGMSASWGAKGLLQYANGNLAKPVKAERYPRIGTAAALEALKAGDTGWFGGPVPLAAGATVGIVDGPATASTANASGASGGAATGAAVSGKLCGPRASCAGPDQPAPGEAPGFVPSCGTTAATTVSSDAKPTCITPTGPTSSCLPNEPAPAPGIATRALEPPCVASPVETGLRPPSSAPDVTIEPPVVDTTPVVTTITEVREALVQVYGVDGEVWLLPGYEFVTTDNGSIVLPADNGLIVVPAVDKSYVEVVQPTPSGEPGAKGLPVPETGTMVTSATALPAPAPAPSGATTVVCIKAPCP